MSKKYFTYITVMAGMWLFGACSDKFLEIEPKGSYLESNYYRNQTEAFNGLVAVYDVVGWQGGGFVTKVGALNAAADDHYAGGGGSSDMMALQVMSNWTLTPITGPQEELWKKGFAGVFRANIMLTKLPGVPMEEHIKKRYEAETKFLRAFFYFDLVRLFKNIPLFTKPVTTAEMYGVVQATPEAVYDQIEADLKAAIAETNLPDQVPRQGEAGRVTKGAAHALLGKVYLYRQKWTDAARELELVNGTTPGQVNAVYGYKLIPRFADLWKSDAVSKFSSESILEVAYNSTSGGVWSAVGSTEGNLLNIMTGPRGYSTLKDGAPDYVSGWSFLVFTPEFYRFMHDDPRFGATVADLDSLKRNGIARYDAGYMNTGYFLNKFAGRVSNISKGGGNLELNFPQNMYEIRLADTYLMEAEARIKAGESGGAGSRAYALLNAVRARVGLGPLPATFDHIFNERRLELAGEGHRWFDLVRTGRAAAALGSRGFIAGRHDILPIPLLEMENTKLEQSKEWGGTK
ncbi:RagB/SusD family nutrient uptake outer membrane protein [Chitinophaga nivalis]|uniref:RagB/SusD family nutrient uptake outer membrane protein n=1 Tax=Chitinophaga nivalis TaxID=2991709 RepID=A0ABT3IG91_9BACT|nr:RagB/SusD family nutrient uptake outer membrane protein [Chitinophaga nivalis]MCW3467331.1 RagB/SusD family nutrient uptake outer membrane protein [Chitinophaga nivalis]MCW3482977.1 RagB/SusD family nutrient uptake outer membrane protein [Chitinophaga nivalis]